MKFHKINICINSKYFLSSSVFYSAVYMIWKLEIWLRIVIWPSKNTRIELNILFKINFSL